MPTRKLLVVTCTTYFLLSACMPLPQYMKIEDDLDAPQSGRDELETRLKQAEDKISSMDLELCNCEASRNQSLKVKAQNTYLININQQLMHNTRRLKKELNKKEIGYSTPGAGHSTAR